MSAYDPYSDPDVEDAMRDVVASNYRTQVGLCLFGALVAGGYAAAIGSNKLGLVALAGVCGALHGAWRWTQVRVLRAPLRAVRDADLSHLKLRRLAFSDTADGPPLVELTWRSETGDTPPQDLRVHYRGAEVLRQEWASATLEEGVFLPLPDGRQLHVRLEPDFWRHRRAAASLGEQELFELRRSKRW